MFVLLLLLALPLLPPCALPVVAVWFDVFVMVMLLVLLPEHCLAGAATVMRLLARATVLLRSKASTGCSASNPIMISPATVMTPAARRGDHPCTWRSVGMKPSSR